MKNNNFFGKNKSKSLISVVLGSYNRLSFIKLTIDSIREELLDLNHEIIVVDGGSDDGTLNWLLEQKDIITIVQHNRGEWQGKKIERKSWGYFMNLAFRAASSKYICMLSDDCLVIPGAIKNGIKLFENELQKGINIGAIAFYWRNWSTENLFHVNYTLGHKMYVNHGMYLKKALIDVDYIDEDNYFFYNGDGDLCLKIWQSNYKIIDSPNSFIEHYPHAKTKIRKSNYIKHDQDLKNYLKKWNRIFYDPSIDDRGGGKLKQFYDKTRTGEKFLNLHCDIVTKNPELTKNSLYNILLRKFKWKMNAVKLKYNKFFKNL